MEEWIAGTTYDGRTGSSGFILRKVGSERRLQATWPKYCNLNAVADALERLVRDLRDAQKEEAQNAV